VATIQNPKVGHRKKHMRFRLALFSRSADLTPYVKEGHQIKKGTNTTWGKTGRNIGKNIRFTSFLRLFGYVNTGIMNFLSYKHCP